MALDNKPTVPTESRHEYAYWAIPGSATTVTYSLPLFHEIDFTVNEGYRKIPHGGIEEGGLLFGTIDAKETRVEAFRPIQCQHASGPSFLLSDQDLELLDEQLAEAAEDPELAGMEVVGWFLSHTRSPLVMTDREAELFDHYFPEPGMLTVLIKPERFQPTRFAFLARSQDRSFLRDATETAIILPLPRRNPRAAAGAVASIPAPAVSAAAAPRVPEFQELASEITLDSPTFPVEAPPPLPPISEVAAEHRNLSRRDRRRRARRGMAPAEINEGPSPADTSPLPNVVESRLDRGSFAGRNLEPLRHGPPAPNLVASDGEPVVFTPDGQPPIELFEKKPVSSAARLALVLPLAALFGCLVGYLAYLQVPSPVIPLTVKDRGQTVLVSWPPEQTRNASYAAMRVDDSAPVLLTPEEKIAGRVEVTATPDMKVELTARNWAHDSRGIIRFIKPLPGSSR